MTKHFLIKKSIHHLPVPEQSLNLSDRLLYLFFFWLLSISTLLLRTMHPRFFTP